MTGPKFGAQVSLYHRDGTQEAARYCREAGVTHSGLFLERSSSDCGDNGSSLWASWKLSNWEVADLGFESRQSDSKLQRQTQSQRPLSSLRASADQRLGSGRFRGKDLELCRRQGWHLHFQGITGVWVGCARGHAGLRGSQVKGSGGPDSRWAWGGVVSLCRLSYRSGQSLRGLAVAMSLHPPCQPGTGPVKTQEQLRPQPDCPQVPCEARATQACPSQLLKHGALLSPRQHPAGWLPSFGRRQGVCETTVYRSSRCHRVAELCTALRESKVEAERTRAVVKCPRLPDWQPLPPAGIFLWFPEVRDKGGVRWLSPYSQPLGCLCGTASLGNSTSPSTPLEGLTVRGAQAGGVTTWFGFYCSPRGKARQTPPHIRSEVELWLHDVNTRRLLEPQFPQL
ncbi:uncharacterized protein LOC144578534 [Callithrix jacchus]